MGVLRAGVARRGRRGPGGSPGDHADAVALADLVLLAVGGRGVDLAEVVLDAAGTAISSSRAGRAAAQNRCGRPRGKKTKLPAAASKALSPQRTDSSPSRTKEHLSSRSWTCSGGPASMVVSKTLRTRPSSAPALQARIACQARASRNHVARHELSHGIHHRPCDGCVGIGRRNRAEVPALDCRGRTRRTAWLWHPAGWGLLLAASGDSRFWPASLARVPGCRGPGSPFMTAPRQVAQACGGSARRWCRSCRRAGATGTPGGRPGG
jgi:hypothetical protein